ncbi:MAG: DUF4352 domain-containing protein [Solirubrobacteraceae bacterium]
MKLGRTVLCAALAAAGCGTTHTVTVTRTVAQAETVTRTRTGTRRATTATAASASASAGATTPAGQPVAGDANALTVHDFNGDVLAVKSDGFADPATPNNQDVRPAAGQRFVAIEVTLTNEGPGTISSDANSNMILIGSDDQAYTAQFAPVTECTNFSEGAYTLLKGNSERGCVVFSLPDGVNIKAMQFSLGNGTVQFNRR